MKSLLKPRLDWLLVFLPIAAYLEFFTTHHTALFICSCIAIIPLAGWMGRATEHLAEKTGDGIGGLLNATFGNAAELIIALVALHQGLHDVVKASITGSIIGNILLVLGAALLGGGARFKIQRFNPGGVRTYSTMLLLAAAALLMPAIFHFIAGPGRLAQERNLSLDISVVLIFTYGCVLWFSLHTHKQLFVGNAAESAKVEDGVASADPTAPAPAGHGAHKPWSMGRSIGVLAGATVLIALVAEWMVGSINHAAHDLGMSNIFVGVVVVAIVGNAAEHSTAILVAMKNRMDLAMGIAVGSSVQVALFVAPVLVFASYLIGPTPLDLVFTPAEVAAIVVAVLVVEQVTADGESNWLEGVQLLSVYAIIAFLFYMLPDHAPTPAV